MEDVIPAILAFLSIISATAAFVRSYSLTKSRVLVERRLIDIISELSKQDRSINKIVKDANNAFLSNKVYMSDSEIEKFSKLIIHASDKIRKSNNDQNQIRYIDLISKKDGVSLERYSERLAHSVVGSRNRIGKIFDKIESMIYH